MSVGVISKDTMQIVWRSLKDHFYFIPLHISEICTRISNSHKNRPPLSMNNNSIVFRNRRKSTLKTFLLGIDQAKTSKALLKTWLQLRNAGKDRVRGKRPIVGGHENGVQGWVQWGCKHNSKQQCKCLEHFGHGKLLVIYFPWKPVVNCDNSHGNNPKARYHVYNKVR